jgi:hypothetical protein
VICNRCGEHFHVSEGGGFSFHLLHCDRCGRERSIGFDELGEIHLRYLKGLPGAYAMVSAEYDQRVRETYPGEPMEEDDYHAAVEQMAGDCDCGGSYSMTATARCPTCHATDWRRDPQGGGVLYD